MDKILAASRPIADHTVESRIWAAADPKQTHEKVDEVPNAVRNCKLCPYGCFISLMTDTIPWKRFGFESALIISSILAALAVDSWWEYRTDREVEQQVLESLKGEFENVRTELDDTLHGLATSYAASKELMTFAGKDLTDAEISAIQNKLGDLYGYHSFDPPSGALQSLITSGQLGLIQNIDLRTRLASWSGPVLDYKDDELELSYIVSRILGPQLDASIPIQDAERSAEAAERTRVCVWLPRRRHGPPEQRMHPPLPEEASARSHRRRERGASVGPGLPAFQQVGPRADRALSVSPSPRPAPPEGCANG